MEKKLSLNWNIYNGKIDKEERYCHNCGKKVEFKDSLKRRQNANGKNIFYFAIYKCPNGHTWNKGIDTFKAKSGLENIDGDFMIQESKYDEIQIAQFKKDCITEIEIHINILQEKIRIDKFLSSKIQDISREKIVELITKGFIRVNNNQVKSKASLREKDVVTLLISKI
ncbi:S4 domain-containing protein [Alkaliphilus sp. B6464]|uniref:S4 domain-containing protein n=1 Tax=Alkaliphilus sp. B6464 TaxID=2731219 RepID=UPI001BA8188D|nr:S4 domain-containing protein [Alkaliphilus sp. B6464]QUH21319.1 cytoplasmic protein [Alkaliphilus sp. B6464]